MYVVYHVPSGKPVSGKSRFASMAAAEARLKRVKEFVSQTHGLATWSQIAWEYAIREEPRRIGKAA